MIAVTSCDRRFRMVANKSSSIAVAVAVVVITCMSWISYVADALSYEVFYAFGYDAFYASFYAYSHLPLELELEELEEL